MIGYCVINLTEDETDAIDYVENSKWDGLTDIQMEDVFEEWGIYEAAVEDYSSAKAEYDSRDVSKISKDLYVCLVEANSNTRNVTIDKRKRGTKET